MLSKVQVEEYNERGYIVVPDVLSRAEVKELQDVTARMVEESRHLTKGDERFDLEPFHSAERPALRRIKTPHLFDPAYARMVRHPGIVACLKSLWGDNVRADTGKLNLKTSGAGSPVEWHQDWAFYPHTNDDLAAVGIMIDAFTPDNGPMLVVPGSHKGPIYDHHEDGYFVGAIDVERTGLDVSGAVPLLAPAGSISIHHARLLHGSAANTSGAERRFLLYQYRAADAWPLMGMRVSFEDYERLIVSGTSTLTPRMKDVPVRLPFPARSGLTTIYEIQDKAKAKFFASAKPEPAMAR
ncbi:MAG: phytanoyl-CoA dioxygenase family protein [Alphaproteobacteria bacterium]|nr:phytanoyl-CoA dioxygenase family protein [Alphaproteobacteria bacterium]